MGTEWQIRQVGDGYQEDFEEVAADIAIMDEWELIACDWWEQTFPDRDYVGQGEVEVMSPDGEVKRFRVNIEAVPHAYIEETL